MPSQEDFETFSETESKGNFQELAHAKQQVWDLNNL